MDKAALLKAIKDAEAKSAKELEEAQAKRQAAVAAGLAEAERLRREGISAVDRQVTEQIADARRRIDADRGEKIGAGRVQIRRKREAAEARVGEVAEYLVREFEAAARAGMR
jgi:vacuolar-type H+-ATPase subunit H